VKFPNTLIDLVLAQTKAYPDTVRFHAEGDGGTTPFTNQEFHDRIVALAQAIKDIGFGKGDRGAIIGPPCFEWEVCDKAIMYCSGISAGLDHKAVCDDVIYMIAATQPRILFTYDLETVSQLNDGIPSDITLICMTDVDADSREQWKNHVVLELSSLLNQYKDVKEDLMPAVRQEDVGAIIFTSGTTGRPKGIPLTQRQLVSSLPSFFDGFKELIDVNNKTIAWVPLHGATGRYMSTIFYFTGTEQYFLKDPYTLLDEVKKVEPTYLVVVPRILEKVHEGLHQKLSQLPFFKRLFARVVLFCRRHTSARLVRAFTNAILIKKINRAIWGRKLMFLISGSAPIDKKILLFFDSIGVPTYEVYGQSEMGQPIAMNSPGQCVYGSAGRPLHGNEVKLASDGEVLVKSEASLKHYYGENDTSDLYTQDGYLMTGDLGTLKDGYIFLTGRKKELIKTSTGLRISPVEIERVYQDIPEVDQIVVVGNGRKFLSALITLNAEFLKDGHSDEGKIRDLIEKKIHKRDRLLAKNRRIKKFHLLTAPFSADGGELTSSLKYRRVFIENKYRGIINSFYDKAK
jgi:long-chain acyl-CoA synthetase